MYDDMVGLELVVVADHIKALVVGRLSSVLCEDGHVHGSSHVPRATREALDTTRVAIVLIINRRGMTA